MKIYNKQRGYITLLLTLFFCITIVFFLGLTNYQFPNLGQGINLPTTNNPVTGGCVPYKGTNPPTVVLNGKSLPRKAGSAYKNATQAKLVISNLYINIKNMDKQASDIIDKDDQGAILVSDRTVIVGDQKFLLLYPSNHVQINDTKKSAVSFGLVFLAKIDGTGNLIVKHVNVKTSAFEFKSGDYLLTDVYQIPNSTPVSQDLIDTCMRAGGLVNPSQVVTPSPTSAPKVQITYPKQNASTDQRQLQLQWFLFQTQTSSSSASGDGFWSLHCKPAIYLYPQEKTEVNVQVNTKGILTYVDPPYPTTGWETTAYPDGTLFVNNKKYDYLYYESKVPDGMIEKPTKGFVASYEQLSQLYGTLLPKLGLNSEQTNDFIEYWEKALPKSPYYFVGVMSEENINSFEPLTITPKPARIIRVRLYFEALSAYKIVDAPRIETPQKKGFTVVEWGGMVKRDKDHQFTCSQ